MGLRKAQRDGDKVFSLMRGGTRMRQDKIIHNGYKNPILRPRPAPLPSLNPIINLSKLTSNKKILSKIVALNYS